MRDTLRWAAVLCVLAMLASAAPAQKGGNPNPGIVPIGARAHGMSYGEWAGAWWNWALQFPPDQSPLLDPDGTATMQGQSGPVYFLVGNLSGEPVERWITIPPGKTLFFPIFNWVFWTPEDGATEADVRAQANAGVDSAEAISCTIDGKAINSLWGYRAQSPPGGFPLYMPEGSLAPEWLGAAVGMHDPSVTDGYWLMVNPLKRGQHTIRTTALAPGFAMDVTYHITVQPPGKK